MKNFIRISIIGLIFSLLQVNAMAKENFYLKKTIEKSFDESVEATKKAFKTVGFGTITEIEMHKVLQAKVEGASIKPYQILGVCNPKLAYEAVQIEENVGLVLPCKVIVKEIDENTCEVVLVNPQVLIQQFNNKKLEDFGEKITKMLKQAMVDL